MCQELQSYHALTYCLRQGHELLAHQWRTDQLHLVSKGRLACCSFPVWHASLTEPLWLELQIMTVTFLVPVMVCSLLSLDNAYRKERRVCVINCLWVFNTLRSWRLLPEGAHQQPPLKPCILEQHKSLCDSSMCPSIRNYEVGIGLRQAC